MDHHIKKKICCVLYTSTEISEREILKKFHLQLHQKNKIKYLGIHLTKVVKDMYTKNYKTLIKENKEDTNKWNDMH